MKHYYAYLINASGNRGSWIANDYPNKKDVLKEISKIVGRCSTIRVEIIISNNKMSFS